MDLTLPRIAPLEVFTFTGVALVPTMAALPNWPRLLSPQARIVPSSLSARL